MATGDLVKLGTLYMGSTKIPRPTKPWRNDAEPYSGAGVGNIQNYSVGSTLEIRDTEANDADKMQWIEENDGGKKYLICDRVMLVNISYDDLNAQNLIFGKNVTIDGQQYKLRVLTGGSNFRSGTDNYSGGSPASNEWDRWVVNEAGLSGLPTPSSSDLDSTLNSTDKNSAHNQKWNWMGVYSWCQETYLHNTAYRAIRGRNSARNWDYHHATHRNLSVGWRPVLEVLNSGPVISGGNQSLGNKTAPFDLTYQVSDPEGDAVVSVVEKLNGEVINTRTNVQQNTNLTFSITPELWSRIPLNTQSTIEIAATDSKSATSTRTYTFTKVNSAPTAIIIEPKGDLANIAIVDTLTPVLVHQFQDTDSGDIQSAYQYIIEDTIGNIVHDTGKKQTSQTFFQVPQNVLSWGVRYKFKVRVWDKYDVPSDYTPYEFFLPNRAPNVTDVQPGTSDINNPMGTGTAPEFTWTFEDLDLEAQQSYQLKIYNISDTLVYDSSRIYKNVNKHQIPDGVLTDGTVYYAVLTVWDPNGLSTTSEKAYFRTNATPSAPILTGPIDNYRTAQRPTLSGIVGTDIENDGMHFAIQISKNSNFEGEVLFFRSDENRTGWSVGGYDIPTEGVFNDKQGQQVSYTLQFDLDRNQTYYWRMAAIDAETKALGKWSPVRKIRVGNVLQFTLKNPISTGGIVARRILFAMDYNLPTDGSNKASIKVEFCNNAFDVNPTWEDATQEFLNMDYYNFQNEAKTAAEFGINVRVTIHANDSLQPIYIDAMGLTFD